MTFAQFLKQFRKDDTAIGDLARDWASDRRQPRKVESLQKLISHLESHDACFGAVNTATKAWRLYIKTKEDK